ncbi:carboxypeptidase-like regulatory domain-containing protein [Halosquirtibacter laminarini]|uniref:Carboxypeptidase-like regulatory domain-containing protein n=1 Tax=Halosquirtibacter laminarini TaxID=3374600 RepID=A0AC61NGM3_9BACT|nr:carboxypeptidase-like regulatory domain-containing protein [Prolixibacteraceae bacterium]
MLIDLASIYAGYIFLFMKNVLFIIVSILISFNALSQIKGIVVDLHTNAPINITAVSVQGKAIGTYTNRLGFFNLTNVEATDSIIFKHLVYGKKVISCTNVKDTIRLKPRIINLNEISIHSFKYYENKTKIKYKNPCASFSGFSGLEVSRLINTNTDDEFIKKIKVFVRKPQLIDSTYVRFHLYLNNKGKPGKEILLSNGLFLFNKSNNHLSIDIESDNIVMPMKGIFVGIEWINHVINNNLQLTPRLLLSTNKRLNQNTYYRFWDEPWKGLNSLLQLERVNAIIQLTTVGRKK